MVTGTTEASINDLVQLLNVSETILRYNTAIESSIRNNYGTVLYSYNNIIVATEISETLYNELQKNPNIEYIESLPLKRYGELDSTLIDQLDISKIFAGNSVNTITTVTKASDVDGVSGKVKPSTGNGIAPIITNQILNITAYTNEIFDYLITATGTISISYQFVAPNNYDGYINIQNVNVINGQISKPGVYNITITASNNYGTDTKQLVLTVLDPVKITNTNLIVYNIIGSQFFYTIESSGALPKIFSIPDIPGILSLNNNIITGTFTTIGTYNMTMIVSGTTSSDSKILTVTTGILPIITSPGEISNEENYDFIYTITSNTDSVVYNVIGILPDGLSFSDDKITGSPTTSGVYNVTLKVTNPFGSSTKNLMITIFKMIEHTTTTTTTLAPITTTTTTLAPTTTTTTTTCTGNHIININLIFSTLVVPNFNLSLISACAAKSCLETYSCFATGSDICYWDNAVPEIGNNTYGSIIACDIPSITGYYIMDDGNFTLVEMLNGAILGFPSCTGITTTTTTTLEPTTTTTTTLEPTTTTTTTLEPTTTTTTTLELTTTTTTLELTTTTTTTIYIERIDTLYNWYVVNDSRKISSSDDFIVPSTNDMTTMCSYITTIYPSCGGTLKNTNLLYWDSPNLGATDVYGFSGIGSGIRYGQWGNPLDEGTFSGIKLNACYWETDEQYGQANYQVLTNTDTTFYSNYIQISFGHSIRLYRLASESELLLPDGLISDTYTGNDNKTYPLTKIGTQIWLAENLKETKYRDGSWLHGFDGGIYNPISDIDWADLTSEAMCYYNDPPNPTTTTTTTTITPTTTTTTTHNCTMIVNILNSFPLPVLTMSISTTGSTNLNSMFVYLTQNVDPMIVDWGDSTSDSYVNDSKKKGGWAYFPSHTYSTGDYTITMSVPSDNSILLNIISNDMNNISFPLLPNLLTLSIYSANITNIDINNLPQLINLSLNSCNFSIINVNSYVNLQSIDLNTNQLTSIDVTNNVNLIELSLAYNQLASINISNNTGLSYLDLSSNQLSTVDLSNNVNLITLLLAYNQLSVINISNNTELSQLYLNTNQLTSINISNNTGLSYLDLSSNQLSTVDLSNNVNINYIDLRYNLLSTSETDNLLIQLDSMLISYAYMYFTGNNGRSSVSNSAVANLQGRSCYIDIA